MKTRYGATVTAAIATLFMGRCRGLLVAAGLAPLASLFFCLSCCFRFSVATNRQPTKQRLSLLFSSYFVSGAN
jgi:hypothetical protein